MLFLDNTIALGLGLFKISFQLPNISLASAGLNTLKLGILLKESNCSTGSWVAPSLPIVIESCVNTYVTGKSISALILIEGFIWSENTKNVDAKGNNPALARPFEIPAIACSLTP